VGPDELDFAPQLLARELVECHPRPTLGEISFHGNPLEFEGAEKWRLALVPSLAEHNAEVFAGLGLDGDDLARLAADRVV
jgi:crotonobetainyl-CoA:carnitine CoA-transferase CaiB-like acyl-CoA transferase